MLLSPLIYDSLRRCADSPSVPSRNGPILLVESYPYDAVQCALVSRTAFAYGRTADAHAAAREVNFIVDACIDADERWQFGTAR
jgi:hypothetical protein